MRVAHQAPPRSLTWGTIYNNKMDFNSSSNGLGLVMVIECDSNELLSQKGGKV